MSQAALPVQAAALPSNQTDGAWPKLVHQDAEWKRGSAQQEGADGETQIQHLLLVHAAEPFLCLLAGGRVAQRHDHGVVLCGERGRAWLQERDMRDTLVSAGSWTGTGRRVLPPVIGYLDSQCKLFPPHGWLLQ